MIERPGSGRPTAVRVRVPATSANLGPGFDAFGLALGLYDEVDVRVVASGLSIDVVGPEPVATDETHLVARSMRVAFDELGWSPPGLSLRCRNRIPHGRGLGSSAAAIVAGVAAADALAGGTLGPLGLLRTATAVEGHPDNVAAAISGGLTVAWYEQATPHSLRVEPFAELRPVVFVPGERQSTEQSRGALPAEVAHGDAAVNVGRAALLALTLSAAEPAAGDVDERARLLWEATRDRLHQPFRLPAAQATAELLERLRDKGIPAALSGSGPSVVALAVGPEQAVAAVSTSAPGFSVAPLAVDTSGVQVELCDFEE